MELVNTFSSHRTNCLDHNELLDLIDQSSEESLVMNEAEIPSDVWELLMQKYTPLLNFYTARFLGTDEMAQDIIQETWIALHQQVQRHSLAWLMEANLSAWLVTVVKHKAINYARRRDRISSLDAQPPGSLAEETHITSSDYPAEIAMREDIHRILYQAIQELKEPQREVIAYRFFCDCSLGEIVQKLDVPLNTVKDRLARAKKQLQRLLLEDGVDWHDLEAA